MRNKLLLMLLLMLLFLLSCNSKGELQNEISLKKIDKIIYNNHTIEGKYKENIVGLIGKLRRSEGSWKFYKKQAFILQYESKKNDTLYTNGYVFKYKSEYFISETNLLIQYQ